MTILHRLEKQGLVSPPKWLPDNTQYLTLMGSMAYGVSSDNSDMDVYGFAISPKDEVFPHLRGEIAGFGTPRPRFEQWQQHHVHDPGGAAGKGQTWDLAVFSIVKFFQLVMENNPNMVDCLFTPQTAVIHSTKVGGMVRERRELFLHRGCWPKFKGYAYAQLHKMGIKQPQEGSKRDALIQQFGFDVKFAYHVVRLLNEVEQLLTEGTLDVQRSREQLKAIRRGEWTEAQIRDYFELKSRDLETAYANSSLPAVPNEAGIKQLLVDCLEEQYGSLSRTGALTQPDAAWQALDEIETIVARVKQQSGG